jgi:hypothetical protein
MFTINSHASPCWSKDFNISGIGSMWFKKSFIFYREIITIEVIYNSVYKRYDMSFSGNQPYAYCFSRERVTASK